MAHVGHIEQLDALGVEATQARFRLQRYLRDMHHCGRERTTAARPQNAGGFDQICHLKELL
jgi:hypothetical protein